ncbi:MAG TPA: glycosyltransferase family 2 protein [Vicinamibacterales bacterium]|nr:glycosyltransferase family 2 protein [Vicinamibacterales bacterium]
MRRTASGAAAAFRRGGLGEVLAFARGKVSAAASEHARSWRALRRRVLEFGIRPFFLRPRVRHLHGPTDVEYRPDELIVLTVVRNGALHVKTFMRHYRALGVRHCVFLDNGSTDGTVEMLREYGGVTILQTDAPYDRYENTMKRYLAEHFSRGRWHLCADIDELFDYPFSDRLPLAGLLRYLDHRGFTAMVLQMLDLFSDAPLDELTSAPDDDLCAKYPYYDISAIDRRPYEWSHNTNPNVRMHWGGIRRAVFGTNNGLTKAALVRMDGKARPFVEWHQVTGAAIADVTGVLRHYPFVGTFRDRVADAVRTGRYGQTTTDEYRAYARGLESQPKLQLKGPMARRFEGLEPLIADGFVVVSDEYRNWAAAYAPSGDTPSSRRRDS